MTTEQESTVTDQPVESVYDKPLLPIPDRTPVAEAPIAPSSVKLHGDLAQVQVDQWGHLGEFIKGQIVKLSELNPAHYDHKHAVRVGTLRMLTEAEARSLPTTFDANVDGSPNEESRAGHRAAAGIPDELPETIVSGDQGDAEPAEFSKPTVAFSGDNQPAGRPIVTEATQAARMNAPASASGDQGTNGSKPASAELVARAQAAQSTAELDAIDAQADNRMTTVHDAVAARRVELGQ